MTRHYTRIGTIARTGLAAVVLIGSLLGPATAGADETLVAVAANFTAAAKDIATGFEAATGHRAALSFGSTGKLYAQITHGAPYQAFLAADGERPAKAEAEGFAVPGTRFTYAIGRLVLYATDPALVDADGRVLAGDRFSRLAIANPKTAPYGAAALDVLETLGLYESVAPRLVYGDNIAQAYQFVATGNAELGFVARAQVVGAPGGSRWVVPADLYAPIRQDAVLLTPGADRPVARAFLDFLKEPVARAIIDRFGYGLEP